MGLIDKKEKIIDFQLTDKGRELLSKNQLNFSYYAFSDDSVDYSGSLSSSAMISGSNLDDYIHTNTFAFEPLRQNNKAINNFLFTMPIQNDVVTQFNQNVTGSITLKRNYETETIENIINNAEEIDALIGREDVLDYVVLVEEFPITESERKTNYVVKQLEQSSVLPINISLVEFMKNR